MKLQDDDRTWLVPFQGALIELFLVADNVFVRGRRLGQFLGLSGGGTTNSSDDIPLEELHGWLRKLRPSDVPAGKRQTLDLFQREAATVVMNHLQRLAKTPLICPFVWNPKRKARLNESLAKLNKAKQAAAASSDLIQARRRVETELREWLDEQFPERTLYGLASFLHMASLDATALPVSPTVMVGRLQQQTEAAGYPVLMYELPVMVDGVCRIIEVDVFPLEILLAHFAELGLIPRSVSRPSTPTDGTGGWKNRLRGYPGFPSDN